jgi:hypothetical protein
MKLVNPSLLACCIAVAALSAGCTTAPRPSEMARAWSKQKPATTCRLRRNPHCYAADSYESLRLVPGVAILTTAPGATSVRR